MKKILFTILLIYISFNIFSQGKYMRTDRDAGAVGYSLIDVDNIKIHSIGVGYTIERDIDLSFAFAFNNNLSSIVAGINYNLFKDKFIMVSPGVGIIHYSFTNINQKQTLNGAFIGIEISGKLKFTDDFSIVPSFNISEIFYQEVDFYDKTNDTSFGFHFAFVVNTSTDLYFGLEPGFSSSNDEESLNLSFFIIF